MPTHLNDTDESSTPQRTQTPSLVVGLGASAGGITALGEFFANVSAGESISYVVILHLSPDYDSQLAQVIQTKAPFPVTQVRETTTMKADHAYVISPNLNLRVLDGTLVVDPMTSMAERKAPVDLFFRTLAEGYAHRAIAVVLSGTGPNGSNGLKRIKEHAGLVIVQDPAEAEFSEMPRNSIATGLVDYVMPVAEMPQRIVEYGRRMSAMPSQVIADPPASEDDVLLTQARVAQDWREILTLLRVRTGQDFSNYKPATIRRRVERRLGVRGLSTLAEYAQLLRDNADEARLLMKELLISVTNFFRDGDAFATLEERVIPALFQRHSSTDQVRVWSAGCATGEEVYSVAMLLAERASSIVDAPVVQVFATDLDEHAIATAREGLYSDADVADVPPPRLARFFQREAAGYRVRRELRETVLFAHHNVIRDPPFSHLDLIVCRNLLIYLNRSIQERLIETFHFALRPGGYLFLGLSESADTADLFVPFDKESHIFESRMVTTRPTLPLADRTLPMVPSSFPRAAEPRPQMDRISPGELHLRLLEQYAPPSLIVNEEYTLLHVSPGAAPYLQIAPGEPLRDVLRLVHPDLRADLRTALHLAARERKAVEVSQVRVQIDGGKLVRLVVRPALREDAPLRGYFLVLLDAEIAPTPATLSPMQLTSPAEPEVRQLADELTRVKAQLRSTIEQYETHCEEARAANEELQAMNEELRSAAEELETSKEELQSVNEELTTVNQELKIKIEELGLTNNDFQNLINSTDIAAIFLDRTLRVKLSTPRAADIFNLLPSDIGRKLSDITTRLDAEPLQEEIQQVLDRLTTVEREVQTREERWYLMRILPYRTLDDRIDGVAMTFHDITARRQAEQRLRAGEERLRLLIDSATDYAIFTMTDAGVIDSWNTGAERMFGYSSDEVVGRAGDILFTADDRAARVPEEELATARARGRAIDERWHMRKDGSRFYVSGVTTKLGDGRELGFAKIARDLTPRRQAELALTQAHADLESRVMHRTEQLQAEIERRGAAQHEISQLMKRLVTAQEEQRARISRDLHDQLGQQLTALRLALERHVDHGGASAQDLDRALAMTRDIDAAIDFLAWELRPTALDDLGLAAALPRYVEEWSNHHGISARFESRGSVANVLPPELETTFYRIVQEALNNVAKHSHAGAVDIVLERRDAEVVLVIEDDGVGFDGTADHDGKGIGLVGMRERAALTGATLQVETSPGNGTTVYLRAPIQVSPSEEMS
jgi:two-component system, chemotaxis family, CheB/CheR fusion protein